MASTEIEDVYIAVTGLTGAGKSSFIALCTGQTPVVGHGLQSQTAEVEVWTFNWQGRLRVHLIDTPGFDDTNKKDVDILRDIASWLVTTYKQKILLSGLIYLHKIDGNRVQGSAKRNLHMFQQLCGKDCLPGIILATTMWDNLTDYGIGEAREFELRNTQGFWGEMIQGGSRVMRHWNTKQSAMDILKVIIDRKHPMTLKLQQEMVIDGRGLQETSAGMQVNQDLIEAERKYKKELDALRQDMKTADEEAKKEIAKLMQKAENDMEESAKARKKLETDMAKLEADRAKDLESSEKKLEAMELDLKKADKRIKEFKETIKQQEESPKGVDQQVVAKILEQLAEMKKDQVAKAEEQRALRAEQESTSAREREQEKRELQKLAQEYETLKITTEAASDRKEQEVKNQMTIIKQEMKNQAERLEKQAQAHKAEMEKVGRRKPRTTKRILGSILGAVVVSALVS